MMEMEVEKKMERKMERKMEEADVIDLPLNHKQGKVGFASSFLFPFGDV